MMIGDDRIDNAVAALRRGELVAFPTETVYGLGADATSDAAVAAIFAAKDRPRFNPLIVHVATVDEAMAHGRFNADALALAGAFWPGPLSLVVPRRSSCIVSLLASAGLDTLALRIPAHPIARRLILAADRPVAAPSANVSGRVSPTMAAHVDEGLCAEILDGGPCALGIESTVVACLDATPKLLRPGGMTRRAIEAVLGKPLEAHDDAAHPLSPGQMTSHYAPKATLRLSASYVAPDEALLAFGGEVPPHGGPMRNLSARGDLREAAACLFRHLHAFDAEGVEKIAVTPVPDQGLGEAINDRLRRAAASRDAKTAHESA